VVTLLLPDGILGLMARLKPMLGHRLIPARSSGDV